MKFKTTDKIFKISLFLKLINGLLEIIGGTLLIFLKPAQINNFLKTIFTHELTQDPADPIANYLINLAQQIPISSQIFLSVYFLSHGIIKIFLIISLLRKKLWAYPTAIAIFSIFIIYQTYLTITGQSLYYLALTALDLIIIILTLIEYKHLTNPKT